MRGGDRRRACFHFCRKLYGTDFREIFFREVSQLLALALFEHGRLPVLEYRISGLPLLYKYIAGTPIVTQIAGWV